MRVDACIDREPTVGNDAAVFNGSFSEGGTPAIYAEIVTLTVAALSDPPESWSALAESLQQLYVASTPAGAVTAPSSAPAPRQSDYDNKEEAFLAVTCTDTNNPRNPFRWPQVAAARDRRFGPFGSFWAYLSEPCATFRVGPGIDPL